MLIVVVSDLADTMQSLQTIAEQCLPETWDSEANIINTHSSSEDTTCHSLTLQPMLKCQFCEESFTGRYICELLLFMKTAFLIILNF